MNADEMRNVAAESVGICRRLSDEEFKKAMREWEAEDEHPHASLTRPSRVKWKQPCPSYDTDMNAMVNLERTMTGDEFRIFLGFLKVSRTIPKLMSMDEFQDCWNSSAEQRLEAYLRTKGLYKE